MDMSESILDSAQVPFEFVELCERWYDGSGSMMYAIASTGNLSRGSIRPTEDDGHWDEHRRMYVYRWRHMTDLEWYRTLFSDLSSDIMWSIRSAENSDDPGVIGDIDDLHNFDAWTDRMIDAIDAAIESAKDSAKSQRFVPTGEF